jgi:hypothetical protein
MVIANDYVTLVCRHNVTFFDVIYSLLAEYPVFDWDVTAFQALSTVTSTTWL